MSDPSLPLPVRVEAMGGDGGGVGGGGGGRFFFFFLGSSV